MAVLGAEVELDVSSEEALASFAEWVWVEWIDFSILLFLYGIYVVMALVLLLNLLSAPPPSPQDNDSQNRGLIHTDALKNWSNQLRK